MFDLSFSRAVAQILPGVLLPTCLLEKTKKPTEQLKTAILNNDFSAVKRVLAENNELVNAPFADGELPLHAAVRLQKSEMVDHLLTAGAARDMRDFQGLTALDYACAKKDIQMVRKLLPSQILRQIDDTQLKATSFEVFDAVSVSKLLEKTKKECFRDESEFSKAIKEGNVNLIKEECISRRRIAPNDLLVACINGEKEIVDLLVSSSHASSLNKTNRHGISPMHVAASLEDKKILEALVAKGGDLLKKNNANVSAADILFNIAESDPLKVSKAQLLLGLMSLGGIIANSYILPMASQEAASYWSAGLLLISTGTDLALSYNAYCQLNPKSVSGKVIYWATTLGTLPVHTMMNKLPAAKAVWDVWRMSSVCKRAMSQLKCAYQNCEYDPQRSLQVLGTELLTVGTSAYHTRESFSKIKDVCVQAYSFPDEVKAWQAERSNQQKELLKAQSELEKDRIAFEKMKSTWGSEVGKQPVCKQVLADEIQTARDKAQRAQQNWEAKLKHPLLPYLLTDDADWDKMRGANCKLLGDQADVHGKIPKRSKEEFTKLYKEMAMLYHPDKCPKDLKPMCDKIFKNLKDSYDMVKSDEALDFRRSYTCQKPAVIVIKETVSYTGPCPEPEPCLETKLVNIWHNVFG